MNAVEELNYNHLKARVKELEEDIREKEQTLESCEEEHRKLILKYKNLEEINKSLTEKINKLEESALNLLYVMKKFR